jgi:hypothetical protein
MSKTNAKLLKNVTALLLLAAVTVATLFVMVVL